VDHYLEDRVFAGRTFADLEDLNCQLLGSLDAVANRREYAATKGRQAGRPSTISQPQCQSPGGSVYHV